jgi:DegV family protein with EDD domain
MNKTLIVTDSSICMDISEGKSQGIVIVPLSVILDEKEYQDQVEMTTANLVDALRAKKAPKTAQPNLGLLDRYMKEWKKEGYDNIIVFALTSHLSGTFQAFRLAATENDMTNLELVDTKTLAAAQREVVVNAAKLASQGASKEEILASANKVLATTFSYLFPETLEQLKRGGRVSPAAAALSSLLKIKALLFLENNGTTIEKMGTARTESKIFEMILDDASNRQVQSQTHKLLVLHCEALETAERFMTAARNRFGDIAFELYELPAVLAAHAGLGTIAVQVVELV